MKILAIEKENLGLSSEAFAPFLTQEAARVWELTQEGIIREIYFRDDQTSAVLILEVKMWQRRWNSLTRSLWFVRS